MHEHPVSEHQDFETMNYVTLSAWEDTKELETRGICRAHFRQMAINKALSGEISGANTQSLLWEAIAWAFEGGKQGQEKKKDTLSLEITGIV